MSQLSRAIFGVTFACLAGSATAQRDVTRASATDNTAAVSKAVNLCSTCHGRYGVSVTPVFPNLAAQRAGYLEAQLKAFQQRTRAEKAAHDFMWGIAGLLDDKIIAGLAKYFSEQKAAPPKPGDTVLIAKGKLIFDSGVIDRGVVPCTTCHGADAQGTLDFPRLAGQNASYIMRQLEAIQSAARSAPVMHGIVQNLTPAEMAEVAEFVQSK